MIKRSIPSIGLLLCLGAGDLLWADWPVQNPPTQTPQAEKPAAPVPGAAPPQTAAPPSAIPDQAPPGEGYTYNPEGRRDPFVSLLQRGTDLRGPMNRPEGIAGLVIGEITVKGIVKTQRGFFAMVVGPDNRTYIVRPNDRVFDGTVRAITESEIVFSQEVNDPLSLVKQREVRKPLRALQEGK